MKLTILGTIFAVVLLSVFIADSNSNASPTDTTKPFNFKETIRSEPEPCVGYKWIPEDDLRGCIPRPTVIPETTTTSSVPLPAYEAPTTTTSAPIHYEAPQGCWNELALQVGWPEHTIGKITRIIQRESGCNPGALADRPSTLDNSYGLLQINTYGYLWESVQRLCGVTDRSQLHDPATNLSCGLTYYNTMGWNPWGG